MFPSLELNQIPSYLYFILNLGFVLTGQAMVYHLCCKHRKPFLPEILASIACSMILKDFVSTAHFSMVHSCIFVSKLKHLAGLLSHRLRSRTQELSVQLQDLQMEARQRLGSLGAVDWYMSWFLYMRSIHWYITYIYIYIYTLDTSINVLV